MGSPDFHVSKHEGQALPSACQDITYGFICQQLFSKYSKKIPLGAIIFQVNLLSHHPDKQEFNLHRVQISHHRKLSKTILLPEYQHYSHSIAKKYYALL